MLSVYSTFLSLQGESRFQGKPCFFIRLAGCTLHCRYCDSRAACESPGRPETIDALVERAVQSRAALVEVTGGEPLLQPETPSLLTRLADAHPRILLETSGSVTVLGIDSRVYIVMDVKCPDSGMSDRFLLDNLHLLEERDHELKFVVSSKADFDWACRFVSLHRLEDRELVLSPVFGVISLQSIAGWMLSGPYPFRLQCQLHKHIWPSGEIER